MQRAVVGIVLVAFTVMLGCSEAPPPEENAAPKPAPPAKKVDSTTRADEIIADLKRREAEQAEIQRQKQAESQKGIPVVTEFSPTNPPGRGSGTASSSYGSPTMGGPVSPAGRDANYWRQEFAVAQAKVQEATQRLDAAKMRQSTASAQLNDPNTAISRMARESYDKASAEVNQLQSEVSNAQSYLSTVRSNAISAGVPPGLVK
jgi:hypothetical protein